MESIGTKTSRKMLSKYSKQEIGKEITAEIYKSRRKERTKELKEGIKR
jgi:hypothetical protein